MLAAGRLGLAGRVLVTSAARFSGLAVRHFLAARTICFARGWSGSGRRLRRIGFGWSCGLSPGECCQGQDDNGGHSEFHTSLLFEFCEFAAGGHCPSKQQLVSILQWEEESNQARRTMLKAEYGREI